MPFFNKMRKDQIKTDGLKRYLALVGLLASRRCCVF